MPGNNKESTFEEIVERLEGIAEKLEGGETALEKALELFEEGVGLAREGQKRLDAAERQVERLLEDDATEPWTPSGVTSDAGSDG